MMDNCLQVCVKANGCSLNEKNTHVICKDKNLVSYLYLNSELIDKSKLDENENKNFFNNFKLLLNTNSKIG